MQTVSVSFRSPGSRVYRTDGGFYNTQYNVSVGDLVLVYKDSYLEIAMVESINVPEVVAKDFIVQVVDVSDYAATAAKYSMIFDVKKAMDARVKSIQESKIYEMLAKEDEELALLLYQYKDLLKSID